jgi:hypothetical protein
MPIVMGNSNCEGSKSKKSQYQLVEEAPFKIVEAYSQDWIAGIQQGGSGTNLYITLNEITETIVVQELFFNGMMVKSQISPSIRNQYIGYFKNEVNTDIIMDEDPIKESQNTPPHKIPFQLNEQEAVIGYLQAGVKRYFKIIDIEKKPLIAYPSNNRQIDQ